MTTVYDLKDAIDTLTKALDEMRKQGVLSKKTYDDLVKKINQDSDAQEKEADQLAKSSKKVAEAKKAAKSFVTNSIRGAQAIRKNREDFRSLNPAVTAASNAAQLAGSAVGKMLSTAGDVVNVGSMFFGPFGKIVGTIAGTGMTMLGNALDDNAKRAAQLGAAFGKFALGELQNVVDAYRTVGSVGGTTARGMTGLYDDAIRAGMSVKEYSQLLADQGQNLASFSGSVTSGAEALGKVSQANEGYKQEFLKLGYTYAEQQKYTGEYLKRSRVLQSANMDDTNKLAEGTRGYLDLLDDMSRLTGMNKDEAAKELEEQQSNVRFQAAQRAATKRTGSEAIAKNMSLVSSGIKAFGSQGLAIGFQDLMSGMGTEAAKEFDRAMGGEGQKIADMVKNGEINADQALEMVHKNAVRMRENVVTDQFMATTTRAGTVMDNIAQGITNLALSENLTVEGLEKQHKAQADAKKAKDKETENITKAQDAMRKIAIDFDKIVKDKVFPLATEAVDEFTDLVVDFVNTAGKTLGFANKVAKKIRPSGGGGGGAAPTPEGGPQSPTAVTEKPELTGVTTASGKSAQVNKDAAPAFQKLIDWLEKDAGYKINSIGGYADRDVRGKSGVKSVHSIGGAIDINPSENPLGSQLVTDMPSNVGDAAKAFGLGWGGAWKSRKDAMHFSAATREGGKILQFANGGIASGPKSGYTAMLHGTEAVVPLPNGEDIPVQAIGSTESTQEQVKALRRQNQIIADLIAVARTNNSANNRLLSLKAS